VLPQRLEVLTPPPLGQTDLSQEVFFENLALQAYPGEFMQLRAFVENYFSERAQRVFRPRRGEWRK
jgi:hypothetical protein